jgi:6-phosphogluconolactonase (cycloisomerase 2 family)
MEKNERMSKRFWLLGLAGLVLLGVLVACGSNYSSSSDGLVIVGSQGSALLESFGFNLNSGGVTALANNPTDTSSETCVLNGLPSSIVIDPAGAYAYTIINSNTLCSNSATGIQAFQIGSDGNITTTGNLIPFAEEINGTVPVVPSTMSMDAAGSFLFVADRATADASGVPVPGAISVFSIGSGGSLTEVPGSPFSIPTGVEPLNADLTSVGPTPTVFPNVGINGTQNSVCSIPGSNPPTAEYLYAVDTANYGVWEFSVNTSTGALNPPPQTTQAPFVASDKVPVGVAVDPCDRFLYVSDSLTNKVSAYVMCIVASTDQTGQQPMCPYANGALVPITGSPFSLSGSAEEPGPLVVDPFGNNVYVLNLLSNSISPLKISPISGSLAALNPPAVTTGNGPRSIAIRQDDNWLFVTNYGGASGSLGGTTVSQYSIAPATGILSALPVIQTDNYPWGIAVK